MAEKERVEEVKDAQAFDYPPVQPGQKVYCQDGYAGKVAALRLNSERKYQAFVVRTGLFFRHRYIVPYEWLDRIESDRVYLSAKKEDLKTLPQERPGPILVIEVRRALREERILHGAETKGIYVSVRRGIISLHGYVPDPTQKARTEKAARQIPGVLGVENRLVADEDLQLAAARAVAQIPDGPVERILVGAQNGYIVLNGEVSSAASRLAAEERAGSVPEIRGVLNRIRVAGLEFPEPRPLQPRIRAKVYARNMVSGHVEQVIVNRVNRLVTAMVVDGMFAEPRENSRENRTHWFLGDSVLVPRTVVIPVHTIRHQTKTAAFLENKALRFKDFDPASFTLPDANWHPPYPYHLQHVPLFDPVEAEQGNDEVVGVNRMSKLV